MDERGLLLESPSSPFLYGICLPVIIPASVQQCDLLCIFIDEGLLDLLLEPFWHVFSLLDFWLKSLYDDRDCLSSLEG